MIMMDDCGVELTYIYNSSGNNQETNEHVVHGRCRDVQTGIDGEGLFRKEMEIWETTHDRMRLE